MKKIPLKDRLAQAGPAAGGGCPLAGAPVACVFQGAYLSCGRRYLSWLLKTVQETYGASPAVTYGGMVRHAVRKLIPREEFREEGYELLYQLTIEPFCLMAQGLEERERTEE